jgi:cell division protein ZapA
MKASTEPVKVMILDKEYLIACPEDEREGLLRAAGFLNRRMKEIRDSGKVVGADRIAVMAALNISHEMLQLESRHDGVLALVEDRVRTMDQRLAAALNGTAEG